MTFESFIMNKLHKKEKEIIIKPHKTVKNDNQFFIGKNQKYEYIKHRLNSRKSNFLDLYYAEEVKPINHRSNDLFTTYGIITNINNKKLNFDNIYIMNIIDASNGVAVKLNLSRLERYSLFPGQLVAITGTNINGNEIDVHNINSLSALDVNCCSQNVKTENTKLESLKICVIVGPFLENNNFNMLDTFFEKDFDVAILCGPFVEHSKAVLDPSSFFDELIMPKIEKWLKRSMTSKVIVIPSAEDITEIGLYPQEPFKYQNTDRLLFLSNPTLFYVDKILFGISLFDNLLQLAAEEYVYEDKTKLFYKNDVCSEIIFSNDKLYRLAVHLIYQASFLPVFPLNEPIDYSQPENLDMDITPDFFITSSKLGNYSAEIDPVSFISLGYQTKSEYKYYAEIQINKLNVHVDEIGFVQENSK
ncbi:DNA-directed DNA polymerase alpha subunit pol12, partial [Conglomerata obtusa]